LIALSSSKFHPGSSKHTAQDSTSLEALGAKIPGIVQGSYLHKISGSLAQPHLHRLRALLVETMEAIQDAPASASSSSFAEPSLQMPRRRARQPQPYQHGPPQHVALPIADLSQRNLDRSRTVLYDDSFNISDMSDDISEQLSHLIDQEEIRVMEQRASAREVVRLREVELRMNEINREAADSFVTEFHQMAESQFAQTQVVQRNAAVVIEQVQQQSVVESNLNAARLKNELQEYGQMALAESLSSQDLVAKTTRLLYSEYQTQLCVHRTHQQEHMQYFEHRMRADAAQHVEAETAELRRKLENVMSESQKRAICSD